MTFLQPPGIIYCLLIWILQLELCAFLIQNLYLGWECEAGFVDTPVRLPTIAEFNRGERNPTGALVCRVASHSHNSLKTCKNKYWLKVQFKVQYSNFAVQWNIFPGLTLYISIFPYPALYDDVFVLSNFHFPCLTSHIVTLSELKVNRKCPGRTQRTGPWSHWPNHVITECLASIICGVKSLVLQH